MRVNVKMTIIFFLSFVQALAASDRKEVNVIYRTGNHQVDFFSNSLILRREYSFFESPQTGNSEESVSKKSPLLAGGLSAIVPGAGEIYNGDYVKAGLFIAVEAASWVFNYNFTKKGDEVTNIFQDYANERVYSQPIWDNTEPDRYRTKWDVIRYYEWTKSNFFPSSSEYNDVIMTDDKTLPPWERVNWGALNRLERDVSSKDNGRWYSHVLPGYGEQQYYELIGKYPQFNQGWDDATDPNFSYGKPVSANFLFYSHMRGLANDYYYKAKTAAVIIVANHILSAADAYFSARAINSKLSAGFRMENQGTPFGSIPVTFGTIRYHF